MPKGRLPSPMLVVCVTTKTRTFVGYAVVPISPTENISNIGTATTHPLEHLKKG